MPSAKSQAQQTLVAALTTRQRLAATFLGIGRLPGSVCEELEISGSTLSQWRKRQDFQNEETRQRELTLSGIRSQTIEKVVGHFDEHAVVAAGVITGLMGSARELTRLKAAESAIEHSSAGVRYGKSERLGAGGVGVGVGGVGSGPIISQDDLRLMLQTMVEAGFSAGIGLGTDAAGLGLGQADEKGKEQRDVTPIVPLPQAADIIHGPPKGTQYDVVIYDDLIPQVPPTQSQEYEHDPLNGVGVPFPPTTHSLLEARRLASQMPGEVNPADIYDPHEGEGQGEHESRRKGR